MVEYRVDELADAEMRSSINAVGGEQSFAVRGNRPTLAIFQDECMYKCYAEETWSWREH